MTHWIFIANPKQFRMQDCLDECGFVEYSQRNKVCVNDIVYIYYSTPIQQIQYKKNDKKTDIPLEEAYDDSRFSTELNDRDVRKYMKFFRLGLIKQVDTTNLSLQNLRNHGLKSSMQSPFKVSGHLLDYIEEQFKD